MVLVKARAGGEQGLGWSYASAAAQTVVSEMLADVVTGRGAFDIAGTAEAMARQVRNIGGLVLRDADTECYRRG
jgi:hypothetical protein